MYLGRAGPHAPSSMPTISSVTPSRAVEGGRLTLHGDGFPVDHDLEVTLGDRPVRVLFASSTRVVVAVPPDLDGGATPIQVNPSRAASIDVSIGGEWATGL